MICLVAIVGVLGAPAPGPYSEANLNVVSTVAEAEMQRLDGRCVEAGGDGLVKVGADREAEDAYLRMAEMRRLVAEHFPYNNYGAAGQEQHSEDIHMAARFYELAYRCNPRGQQQMYLSRALAMVKQRRQEIAEKERRPDAEDDKRLAEDEAKLSELLAAQVRPPEPRGTRCDDSRCPKTPGAPAPATRGYRKRWMDLLTLRVEIGPSVGMYLYEGVMSDGKPDNHSRPPVGLVFSVTPGIRLLAGPKQRHVFGLGFRYTMLAFREEGIRDRVSQMSARFEYGIRLHPDWFSLHGGFEPGIQSHAKEEYFGQVQLGGFGSLCTWGEAICFRVGGSKSVVPANSETYLSLGTITLGLDVFRIADNLIRQTEVTP